MGRFCRYLPSFGVQPLVVTVQDRFYRTRDNSFMPPEGLRIERTTVLPTPIDIYHRWKQRRSGPEHGNASSSWEANKKKRRRIRRLLVVLLQLPDPDWGWYLPAVRAAEKFLETEPIAAIFSTGPPWVSHLVARHLRKKYRVPWLADFRDPWSYDPFTEDLPAWRHWLNGRMERNCVSWADRVLCNTPRLREFFVDLYSFLPAEKFVVLPNGFDDPVIPQGLSDVKNTTRLFLHLGSLYAQRRIDTFCEAIANLVKAGKLPRDSFRVLFLGDLDPSLETAARQKTPDLFESNCIQFRPRVSWQQAQQILWEADILLLFQGYLTLEVPAKFFEYLPTGKPMFAVVKKGALSDILDLTGSGSWADPDNPAEITAKFLEVLEQPNRTPLDVQRQWFSTFHYRALTEKLAGHIFQLVGNAPR